jgi:hypothetical protein
MNEDMQSNPDYQLVMKFLQSIRPGDMDDESAQQLIAIGQRIQNGGVLSDREREMLASVVGAMPQMPMNPGDYAESLRPMAKPMPMDPRSAGREIPMPEGPMNPGDYAELLRPMARQSELPSLDGETYGPSSGVTTMDMQQMIDAGIINPNRPRPRPENLGQMRPRPRPASME